MSEVNHYAVLGVRRGAGPEEIRLAYVRRLKSAHPDLRQRHLYPQARLEDLQQAYHCLRDADTRSAHDAALNAQELIRIERQRRRQRRLKARGKAANKTRPSRRRRSADPIRARWRLALLLALLLAVGLELAKRS